MSPSGFTTAPTLETPRLVLRAHGAADFNEGFALWSDPEVVRFIGGRPATSEDAWGRLLRYVGHWTALGYGFWAVIDKASGRFIGEVGLGDFHRTYDLPLPGALAEAPEAGWAFAVAAHGRGYATEAVTAALAWSDAHLAPPLTLCVVHPDNDGSLAVARKCGFGQAETLRYRGEPTVVLRRPRPTA